MKRLPLLVLLCLLMNLTSYSQVNINLPVLEREIGSPDEYFSVTADNINLSDNVMQFSFFLYYDKNIIQLDDCKLGTLAQNSLGSFNADIDNGVMKVAFIRLEPYYGSGSLVELKVKFIAPGTSVLSFVDGEGKNTFDFRDGVPQAITNEGSITVTKPVSVDETSSEPAEFKLEQNYPNPFNPSTSIAFSLSESGFTTLKICNVAGEEVAVLASGDLNAGRYEFTWNAAGKASGVYYVKLQSGSNVAVKKILLLK